MSLASSLTLPAAAVAGVFHPTLKEFYLTTPPISCTKVLAYDKNGVMTKVGNAHNQDLAVSGTGALPTHTRLDPTEKFLYVLDRLGVLHVFDILADGTVAENHTPFNLGLPTGTVPLGLAVLKK
ncbi:MAG: lactonase family protein [Acidobacteriia bacterium]|nr:lactonase family protein [Terriglobia bacterium]